MESSGREYTKKKTQSRFNWIPSLTGRDQGLCAGRVRVRIEDVRASGARDVHCRVVIRTQPRKSEAICMRRTVCGRLVWRRRLAQHLRE